MGPRQATGGSVDRPQLHLAVSGPSGTGKTHFCGALGGAVIEQGMRVAWFTLESLLATIGRAKVDASVQRVVAAPAMPKSLATAAVDRFLHHAHMVITEGGSLRLAEATAGKGVTPLL